MSGVACRRESVGECRLESHNQGGVYDRYTINVHFLDYCVPAWVWLRRGFVACCLSSGLFGLKTSVTQIGSALIEMQENVDALQKNMGTIKQAKDQLSSLSPAGSDAIKGKAESLKQLIPGMGQ